MLLRCIHLIVISLAVQGALGLPIPILGADLTNDGEKRKKSRLRIKHALFQADLRLTDPVDLSKDIVATTFPPQVTYQSILSS